MARKKPSSSSSPIMIGNCQVVVEAKNFKAESNQNNLQISLSRNSKIVISVVEDAHEKEHNDIRLSSLGENGDYNFVLVNPKDSDVQSKSLLQEILSLYTKELPSMNYAANTGKKSMFLDRCVSNGKYCTLVLKSNSMEGSGEVVAAITFQIIPADTQYAEVPLAAVSSIYQHKGIGHLIYLEMRKRLQSVGVHSIFCWADEESEGFWLKQGFKSVGEVDAKGKARKLAIKADIRKALCFPGGSTLMIAHLHNESSAVSLQVSSLLKSYEKSTSVSIGQSQHPGPGVENLITGCQDLVCMDSLECMNTENNVEGIKISSDFDDARLCSCSSSGAKKRTWESSHTSLKSKKVKGGHMIVCQSESGCVSRNNNSYKIMLMNIADDAKKSNLTKIIEDLGGSVTSDGRVSTHVITGKIRKTLNFCTALCSGAWVISPAWLKESFRQGRFVDERDYIVKDVEYELKYRTELKNTVVKARANPGGLLKGFEVCLAAHVQPPVSTMSAIVRSAGGNVIGSVEKAKDSGKTIFVASEEGMEEALSAVKKGIATFSNEWFMNCVMKQELDLEAPKFAESL
ncbi:uncharacterized protein LOC111889228 [Lactuca sativa]|uniref:BRCT domain-containing protein n=1 Tax=Lactuca sativa TaxID=4236 RepID=A0A9R1USY6_LACSA|nr:uncharacterized protein LOC111889228 [Lactuca sativa]KAJ0192266.1 hypothetical protein LSAT_V11C800421800 [Lactuca sativa]